MYDHPLDPVTDLLTEASEHVLYGLRRRARRRVARESPESTDSTSTPPDAGEGPQTEALRRPWWKMFGG
jgi:hypothetical protein